ncbi:MAG: Hpt domain-containing protein [Burkholderiales bacterium]|nr:Hpt domain-containing protein [Burkholderiales bacterium]
MQTSPAASGVIDHPLAMSDLGPLAWVLEELRKSLDNAAKSLRRFAREADPARGANAAGVDTNPLRMARQYIHQSVGALEMVGLVAPANVLRAMESAAQRFLDKPELCTEAAASRVERCGFALSEYLESVLSGKPVSAVSLFPQYRDVQELAGSDRIHPADLWSADWKGAEPELDLPAPLNYGPEVRNRLDRAVLGFIKAGDPSAAAQLCEICLGLAAGQQLRQTRVFWKISAAFFDALARRLIAPDVYVKRATSRILLQYAALARGDSAVSERLMQDLLFFCAQSGKPGALAGEGPVLNAVRQACGLGAAQRVDYEVGPFGRFDPAVLAQARKRIESAKDSWSALAGGDAGKIKIANDQFHLVGESLVKLHPPSVPLAQALNQTLDAVQRSGVAPGTELAIEVATAVLFLEAAFEDLDPSDPQLEARTRRLAERLERVRGGAAPEALEPWMEELYRRVSDRQTMGTVVGELRVTLGELEKSLDQFFRNPREKGVLRDVPGQLAQMRGVMSVLGLDQAAQTVLRMRDSIEQILETDVDEEQARAAGTFDKLGNNIGAMGFLIDMLNYQPALAKKLFVFDEAMGELRPLMGRTVDPHGPDLGADTAPADDLSLSVREVTLERDDAQLTARLDQIASHAALADQHELAKTARQAAVAVSGTDARAAAAALDQLAAVTGTLPAPDLVVPSDLEEDDLRGIFLDEAREVFQTGHEALDGLREAPSDTGFQTTLRRAFHTLKGSSRMVGLNEFGEAAWSLEQLLNGWLAEQKPINAALHRLCSDAFAGLGAWVEDIAADSDQAWKAEPFRRAADAMRTENRVEPLVLPPVATTGVQPVAQAAPTDVAFPEFVDMDFGTPDDTGGPAPATAPLEITDIDLSSLAEFSTSAHADAPAEVPLPQVQAPDTAPAPLSYEGQDTDLTLPADMIDAVDLDLTSPPPESPVHFDLSVTEDIELDAPLMPDEAALEPDTSDDQIKVIDSLRVSLPLYNVYLGEADEWSRRLVTELAEWALELDQTMPDSAIGLAHSLAGSSATVGFTALSDMARLLEHALQHAQVEAHGTPRQARVFSAVADDIRRLLHQFAAGFLKAPDPEVLDALRNLQADEAADEALSAGLMESATDDHPPRTTPHLQVVATGGQVDAVSPQAYSPSATDEPSTPATMTYGTFSAPRVTPTATDALASQGLGGDVDDDIDAIDAIDPDLFPIFEEEAAELLPQLGGALRQWAARPGNLGARNEALRTLHTLKGSARLAGAMRLGELAHRMESEIEEIGHDDLHTAQIEPLLTGFDVLQGNFDGLRVVSDAPAPDMVPQAAPTAESPVMAEASPHAEPAEGALDAAPSTRTEIALPAQTVLAPMRQGHQQAVRVRSHLLDRLVTQAGEVMITRSRLEAELGQLRGSLGDLTGNLDRLRSQLRDVELQAETQMQSRLAQAKDSQQGFDPLEFDRFTRVQELTRMMAESVNDVATVQRNIQRTVEATEDDLIAQARQTRELQRDLLRTRMVEFEGISERLYRVVRQASKDTGKQVKLDITGGSIEMDRGVLDRMTPAFEHLLRNCVAHGIEDPSQRLANGKEAAGTITVDLHHEGNDVALAFTDDGAGLNLPRIREKAAALGLLDPGQALSDAEVANLIFLPGFSTAADVTELAGRGIGMDVVRAEVNALGGRIETSTQAGQGTTFRMVLPLTTAVTQVVMLRFGTQSIGVPSNVVEIVRRAPAKEVEQAYNNGTLDYGGEQVPFFWAGALLQASQRSTELQGKTLPVVVLRSAAQRVALHVDEVLGNQEVVVKNLGPQLARLPGLAGMTVLASGAVVLIYNPVALASVYGAQARRLSADHAQPHMLGEVSVLASASGVDGGVLAAGAPSQVPLVMVVDDSITVRRVTQRLLQREGYRVVLAADGLQALERLQDERPSVVLSDIEMPRMDGFDLARNIRGDAKLKDLPIIMITSRIATKHRDHAMELGVNHYLGKPYPEDELLSLVRRYTHVELEDI